MLRLRDVNAGYGNLQVLRGLDLRLEAGEVVALIGGNGVGKTTAMRTIVGLLRPSSGSIELNGIRIDRESGHRIFRRGIALVPQGRELFPDMSVHENLELGALSRTPRDGLQAALDRVLEIFPRLRERARQRAGTLSGGEQQMLATGRALVSQPDVLLLDEPTAGLAPIIVGEFVETLRRLGAAGQTILIVEQNMRVALSVGERVYIMRGGRVVHEGRSADLANSDEVFKAFIE
jgi:branched-chain amino acid transport system ATP-binding protein